MHELILVDTDKVDPAKLFSGHGVDELLDDISKKARAVVIDISTESGREECASIAYKVANAKNALDNIGKTFVAGLKDKAKKIDTERGRIWDHLEALQLDIRKPLTEYQNAEKSRVLDHETRIAAIMALPVFDGFQPTADDINDRLSALTSQMQRDWQEFGKRATEVADAARTALQKQLVERLKYEADQAELLRLREEAAKREQADRDERIRKEAAESAIASAAKSVADAKAREEAALLAAEQARIDAVKQATEAAQKADNAKADAEVREKQAKEEAAKAERDRIAKEKAADEAAAAKRESNKKHCAKVNLAAVVALTKEAGIGDEQAKAVIVAIAKGLIPSVTISY